MKKLTLAVLCLDLVIFTPVLFTGCMNPTQQKIAVNTISSLEISTAAAYDAYISLVLKDKVSTNDVPKISRAYNSFQESARVAFDVVQANTNALAPANLVIEATDIINLINQAKGGK